MSRPSGFQYLDGKVLTASQPRLHLMLLEGALRFGRQARALWDDPQEETEANALLARAMDIVEELCLGAAAGKHATSKQLEEQYAFLFRELSAARIHRDSGKLDASLRILEFQRETWKLVCEKLEADETPTPRPLMPHMLQKPLIAGEGFSLEA